MTLGQSLFLIMFAALLFQVAVSIPHRRRVIHMERTLLRVEAYLTVLARHWGDARAVQRELAKVDDKIGDGARAENN